MPAPMGLGRTRARAPDGRSRREQEHWPPASGGNILFNRPNPGVHRPNPCTGFIPDQTRDAADSAHNSIDPGLGSANHCPRVWSSATEAKIRREHHVEREILNRCQKPQMTPHTRTHSAGEGLFAALRRGRRPRPRCGALPSPHGAGDVRRRRGASRRGPAACPDAKSAICSSVLACSASYVVWSQRRDGGPIAMASVDHLLRQAAVQAYAAIVAHRRLALFLASRSA